MKAIVLEVKNGTSACLREDGTIVEVHAKHPVGQTIELKEGKIVKFKEAIAGLTESRAAEFIRDNAQKVAMAAAALVCVFLGTGIYSYNNLMAASYMSVDVNPSLEYTLNRMDKVIDVRALNDDAVKIVDELKEAGIKHATVAETISETTRILEKENYIASDKDNVMLVGITGANKHKSGDIDMQVHTVADGENMTERVSVYTLETSKQDRKEAQKRGISAGRYATAKAICDKNNVDMSTLSDDDFDQITHMSVASLIKEQDGENAEVEEDSKEEEKKSEEKKEPEVSEAEALTTVSAPSEVKSAAVDVANQSAEQKDESEDNEEKSDSKKSSSKKKKTTSGDSADKSKASVSSVSASKAAAKSSSENSAAAADNSTASADSGNSIVNTSENAVAVTTVVTTDDGVALTVVVPDNTQITAPQDTTVEQYEQTYKELVNAVTPAVTAVENPEAAASGTTEPSGETAVTEKTEETETVVEVNLETVQTTESTATEKTE